MSTEPENGAGFVEGFDDSDELTDDDIVTITNEDGEQVECAIVAVIVHDGQQYVMMHPVGQLEEPDIEEIDAYVYHYAVNDDELPVFSQIEDDDVFDAVCNAFGEM